MRGMLLQLYMNLCISADKFYNHQGDVILGAGAPGKSGVFLKNSIKDRLGIGVGMVADDLLKAGFAEHLPRRVASLPDAVRAQGDYLSVIETGFTAGLINEPIIDTQRHARVTIR